jgi:hypothetical protein
VKLNSVRLIGRLRRQTKPVLSNNGGVAAFAPF